MKLSEGDARGVTLALLGTGVEARAAYDQLSADVAGSVLVFDDDPTRAQAFAAERDRAEAVDAETLRARIVAAPAASRLLLRAPGAPPSHPLLTWADEVGLARTTFTGLWLAANRGRIAATITGTKGKSTTTQLFSELAATAGNPCLAVGNIGVTPIEAAADARLVMELSSYQLHDVPAAATVHVVTNLYREHLDWHGGEERYHRDKCRPFELSPKCVGVLGPGLSWVAEGHRNQFVHVGDVVRQTPAGWDVRYRGESALIPADVLKSAPNAGAFAFNLATAITACLVSDVLKLEQADGATAQVLSSWRPLASRQRVVSRAAGREWIDDALATIPEATLDALAGLEGRRVRLILGGRDRGQDFAALARELRARPDISCYVYGPTAERLSDAVSAPLNTANDFDTLLERAFSESDVGDVILFSPAAATHESGQNYESRQRRFAAFAHSVAD